MTGEGPIAQHCSSPRLWVHASSRLPCCVSQMGGYLAALICCHAELPSKVRQRVASHPHKHLALAASRVLDVCLKRLRLYFLSMASGDL